MKKYRFSTILLLPIACLIIDKTGAQTTQTPISDNKKSPRATFAGFGDHYQTGYNATIPVFSQATRQFNYRINATGAVTPSGYPFQIQLGAHYGF